MSEIKSVHLSEIAELITKGTTPTTIGYEFQEEGINFLKIECFDENGNYNESKTAYISEECHEKLKRSQLQEGDILFSIAGAIGRVAIVKNAMLPANTNQALAIIRIKHESIHLPYQAWRYTKENGLDTFTLNEFIWDKDVTDFTDTLKAAGITEFFYTDNSTAVMDNIHDLDANGFRMTGLATFEKAGWWKNETETVRALRFEAK